MMLALKLARQGHSGRGRAAVRGSAIFHNGAAHALRAQRLSDKSVGKAGLVESEATRHRFVRIKEEPMSFGTFYRFIAGATFAMLAFIGSQTVARADCGEHALQTIFAPIYTKAQAVPLTPETIYPKGYWSDGARHQSIANVGVPSDCPDDAPATASLILLRGSPCCDRASPPSSVSTTF